MPQIFGVIVNENEGVAVYTNNFYDASVIFSNFVITLKLFFKEFLTCISYMINDNSIVR